MSKFPRSNQGGFILIIVLMMISMIAAVVYFTNHITSFASNQSADQAGQINPQNSAYAIQAALVIAAKELQEDGDCTAYSIDPTGTFNNIPYSVSLSDTSGSPVRVTVSVEDNGTLISEVSRAVKMFDNTGGTTDTMDTVLNPIADTFINGLSPDSNFNEAPHEEKLRVMSLLMISFLKFPLLDFEVPIQYVTSSQLELHVIEDSSFGNSADIMLHRVTRAWNDNAVNFRDRLEGIVWDGYYFTSGDNYGSELTQTEVDESVDGWKYWDADQIVTEWLDGTYVNYGLGLRGETFQYNSFDFHSSSSSDTAKQPILRITHYCECGSSECDEVEEEEEIEEETGCSDTEVMVLYPTEDSFINAESSNGNSESLNVKSYWGNLSFIKFDLSSLTVPAADIVSSKLAVHLKGAALFNTADVYLKNVKLDWDESYVTYSQRLSGSGNSWNGDYFPGGDNSGPILDTNTVHGSVIGWEYWDATQLVDEWIDGTYPNYGLVMYGADDQNNNFEFHSSNTSDTEKRPYLEITHLCQ